MERGLRKEIELLIEHKAFDELIHTIESKCTQGNLEYLIDRLIYKRDILTLYFILKTFWVEDDSLANRFSMLSSIKECTYVQTFNKLLSDLIDNLLEKRRKVNFKELPE